MAVIRHATTDDIAQIIAMGEAMHAESPRYRTLGFKAHKVGDLAFAFIKNPALGGVLVAEKENTLVGMFAFHISEHFFSDDLFASDIVMYIKPEHRGGSIFPRFVAAFEILTDERGVKEKLLGVSTGVDAERTLAVLARLGYLPVETGTMKGY